MKVWVVLLNIGQYDTYTEVSEIFDSEEKAVTYIADQQPDKYATEHQYEILPMVVR